jgi:hypothetical protein
VICQCGRVTQRGCDFEQPSKRRPAYLSDFRLIVGLGDFTTRARKEDMNEVLDHEFQSLATEAICHEARMAGAAIQETAGVHQRPSAVFRPALTIDGNQWCALYGGNLQDGVAGFGASPVDAMWDFDKNWHAKLPLNG